MASKAEAKALLAQGRTLEAGQTFQRAGYPRQALSAYTQGEHWLQAAKLLEAEGKPERAIPLFRKAGEPAEAARLLADAGQHEQAAQAYAEARDFARSAAAWEAELRQLRSRGAPPQALRKAWRWAGYHHARAGDPRRGAALLADCGDPLKAAELLESHGLHVDASRQFLALGLREQAMDALMRAEQPADAARLAEQIGEDVLAGKLYRQAREWSRAQQVFERAQRWQDAADAAREIPDWAKVGEMSARAGDYLLSATAYLEAGEPDEAIKSLSYIKSRDPAYAEAVPMAVDALERKGDMSFAAERFLHPFLAAPLTEPGKDLVYRLARVYEQGEFWETAEEHYARLLQRDPGYRDCTSRLEHVRRLQKDSAAVYKQVLKEDFAYQETTERLDHARQKPPPSRLDPSAPLQREDDLDSFPDLPGEASHPPGPTVASGRTPTPPRRPAALAETTTGRQATVSGTALRAAPAGETRLDGPAAAVLQLQPGALLGERYELIDRVGSGGRGAVYRARDRELDEIIAVKVIHPTDVTDESLAWFRQEIKLARKLTHPNVIRLHDIHEVAGLRFLTMEYLDGQDLDDVIAAAGNRFPFPRGIDYMKQTASALGAAHQLGIIHRDIKPPNLFVVGGDTIKILDFGIAKLMDVEGLSRTGLAYGTPQYMSPEQIRGDKQLDTRTDLYSLGCVMFNLFTGELVFDADETFALMLAHVNQPPPRPRELRPDMPPELEAVILRLLEKDPGDRYATCADLERDLEALG